MLNKVLEKHFRAVPIEELEDGEKVVETTVPKDGKTEEKEIQIAMPETREDQEKLIDIYLDALQAG